jgi:predicted nucleic-acid-binding Zn-ribbon protein
MPSILVQIAAIFVSLFLFWLFFTIFFKHKNENKEDKWAVMCPKCGSLNVKKAFLAGKSSNVLSVLNPNKYICNDCENEGIFPEVDLTRVAEIRKKFRIAKR